MSVNGQPIISLRGIEKVFATGRGEVRALDGIDLDVYPGEYVSVMGPSGSGKSTLFNMIGALDLPTAGAVTVGGVSLADLSSRRKAFFRGRHLGYIFQAYNLIESMTARKNVALPLILGGTVKGEAMRRADAVLEEVGLGHRLDHRPDELSGGQQQRVAIARALVNNPTILLADEPTANLDLTTGLQIIEIIKDLSERRGVTVVTATHDHEMLRVSDRVVWIADGRIERVASRDEIHIEVGTVEQ
ncbi:MAG: ABC transporter ATP-binding protein [Planctomycetota bacterium]|jgi:putative ABC transport system ATP-binding protein